MNAEGALFSSFNKTCSNDNSVLGPRSYLVLAQQFVLGAMTFGPHNAFAFNKKSCAHLWIIVFRQRNCFRGEGKQ